MTGAKNAARPSRKQEQGEGSTYQQARQAAVRLLEYQGRSEEELKNRLELKGFEPRVVAQVVAEMVSLGWINDSELGNWWIDRALNVKPMGKKRLLWELQRRGLKGPALQEAVEEQLNDQVELDLARRWVRSKLEARSDRFGLQGIQERRRLAAGLNRLGFSETVIHHALQGNGTISREA